MTLSLFSNYERVSNFDYGGSSSMVERADLTIDHEPYREMCSSGCGSDLLAARPEA